MCGARVGGKNGERDGESEVREKRRSPNQWEMSCIQLSTNVVSAYLGGSSEDECMCVIWCMFGTGTV